MFLPHQPLLHFNSYLLGNMKLQQESSDSPKTEHEIQRVHIALIAKQKQNDRGRQTVFLSPTHFPNSFDIFKWPYSVPMGGYTSRSSRRGAKAKNWSSKEEDGVSFSSIRQLRIIVTPKGIKSNTKDAKVKSKWMQKQINADFVPHYPSGLDSKTLHLFGSQKQQVTQLLPNFKH